MRTGRCHLDAALPRILEDGSTSLSGALRFLLVELKRELEQLAGHIEQAEALIQRAAQQSEVCQRLDAIPGIGPLTATALIAAIGNGEAFRKGREFAAWVGLVPREHSTGGKQKLLGISKRGNSYLRKLFVQGARAVLQFREKQSSGLRTWLAQLTSRTHYNVVGVALANKLARMAWAVLAKGKSIGLRCLLTVLLPDRSADDAWLKPGLEIASAIPTSAKPATTAKFRILPGLLANHEMAQRSNPALLKPETGRSPSRLRY